ncbi:MAG: dihydroorotase [Myxococcota bacterium]
MRTEFRRVRLFDPGSGLDQADATVVVEGGTIVAFERRGQPDQLVDGQGLLLCPGIIDLRAHLGQPGRPDRETVLSATRAAAKGGTTTVVALPATDRVEVVAMLEAWAKAAGPTRVLPAGAFTVGRQGERLAEFAKLRAAGCVLFTDGNRPIRDAQLLRYGLETAVDVGVPVMTHAEDETLAQGGVMHEGAVSARLGLVGIPRAAEEVGVARDLAVAELTGAAIHISHVSSAGSVELIRQAKRRGVRVSADVSPHHLLLDADAVVGYATHAKLRPPLREASDRAALVEGLADGSVDAVASDHEPRTNLEKNVEFDAASPGAAAIELLLPTLTTLVAEGALTLERALSACTRGPARILGREDLGRLRVGGPADLVLLDPEAQWSVGDDWQSRARNTPLWGRSLSGRPLLTMVRGRMSFADHRFEEIQ